MKNFKGSCNVRYTFSVCCQHLSVCWDFECTAPFLCPQVIRIIKPCGLKGTVPLKTASNEEQHFIQISAILLTLLLERHQYCPPLLPSFFAIKYYAMLPVLLFWLLCSLAHSLSYPTSFPPLFPTFPTLPLSPLSVRDVQWRIKRGP